MKVIDLPDSTRVFVVLYEDDTFSVRLIRNCTAIATSERAVAECIATLVDEGHASPAEGLALCVELARQVEAATRSDLN